MCGSNSRNGMNKINREIIKNNRRILSGIENIVNHVFCDAVCEPVCGRKKTLSGYEDERGIPCARNTCELFNDFADLALEQFKKVTISDESEA